MLIQAGTPRENPGGEYITIKSYTYCYKLYIGVCDSHTLPYSNVGLSMIVIDVYVLVCHH